MRRFEQDTRSASALNHPNIITIHDIRLRHVSAKALAKEEASAEEEGYPPSSRLRRAGAGQVGDKENLRDDPHFKDILRCMNLPE